MENKIQILLVEDEAIIAENIRQILEDFFYEVVEICYNFQAGIQAIENKSFDLAIFDINLGHHHYQTGLDLAAHLQKIKQVPFIFLTAFSDKDTIQKAAVLKPSAYLVKPVNEGSLFAAIQLAINNFSTKTQPKLALNKGAEAENADFFFLKLGHRINKIHWANVYCIKGIKNYVELCTPEKPTGYLVRGSLLSSFNYMVPDAYKDLFVQVNRSTIITLSSIIALEEESVTTTNGVYEITKSSYTILQKKLEK